MKRILALAAVLAVLAAIVITAPAGAQKAGPTASAAAVVVKLKDSFFSPSKLTVSRGTKVRFVWAGKLSHNLVGGGLPGSLARTRIHGSYTATFTSPGTKTILCTIHPGMVLKLRVR
ncbi:MAG TPA: plastocyanin/azurin family copper-binding protein [Solirubrobacteraceae bacterium]|nr:plastocyanin/azurin family copper-binding protein [Solirubrobacteraceae bacterium]